MAGKGEKKIGMEKQEQESGEDHSSKNIGIFAGPKKGSVFPKDRELISTKMGPVADQLRGNQIQVPKESGTEPGRPGLGQAQPQPSSVDQGVASGHDPTEPRVRPPWPSPMSGHL
nr:hypothetical protein Itr_chr15CG15520 [Ipomoea trifida]